MLNGKKGGEDIAKNSVSLRKTGRQIPLRQKRERRGGIIDGVATERMGKCSVEYQGCSTFSHSTGF